MQYADYNHIIITKYISEPKQAKAGSSPVQSAKKSYETHARRGFYLLGSKSRSAYPEESSYSFFSTS